ncbi:hypothetical protein quinque_013197 [Culex quinquefasciatus]
MKELTVLSLAILLAGYTVAQNVTTKTLANGTVIEYIEYTDYTEYTYYDPTITSTSSGSSKPNRVRIFHVNRRSVRNYHNHNRRAEYRIADYRDGIVHGRPEVDEEIRWKTFLRVEKRGSESEEDCFDEGWRWTFFGIA